VDGGAGRRAAWQDETSQRRRFTVEAIDRRFEPRDVGVADRRLGDARRELLARIGELRAEREQIALDLRDGGGDRRLEA